MKISNYIEILSLLYSTISNFILICYCIWISSFHKIPFPFIDPVTFTNMVIGHLLISLGCAVSFSLLSKKQWKSVVVFFNLAFTVFFSFLSVAFNNGS